MASDTLQPSSFPASMGPGARASQAGQPSPGTTLREVMDIRRSYDITVDANSLHLGYQLDGQARRYSIPFENMPIGALTQRMCFGGARGAQVTGIFIIDAIRGAENMTGEQLSQTEAEGFAKHSVKRIQYAVVGNLAAVAGGYALAYRGIKDMKFPFMKPKDAQRYTTFPNRFFPILRDSGARLMWQVTRFNVYALIGLFAAGPVFASMGDVSMMAGMYQDSRTRSPQQRQPAPQPNPSPTSSSSSDFFFDDASPTADNASARASRSSATSRDGSGESVWSRIRRGNTPTATSAPTLDSSFSDQTSYSSQPVDDDQQQQRQRRNAQKEFDAMVEQERRQSGREDFWKGTSDQSVEGAGEGESAWERRRHS
ncbi:hypothetical protein DV736_g6544, partial [Chaetothyriales sp. CBS 134916]